MIRLLGPTAISSLFLAAVDGWLLVSPFTAIASCALASSLLGGVDCIVPSGLLLAEPLAGGCCVPSVGAT